MFQFWAKTQTVEQAPSSRLEFFLIEIQKWDWIRFSDYALRSNLNLIREAFGEYAVEEF